MTYVGPNILEMKSLANELETIDKTLAELQVRKRKIVDRMMEMKFFVPLPDIHDKKNQEEEEE